MRTDQLLSPPRQVTPTQLEAGLAATLAIATALRTLGSVPSGELYARVMDRLSLASYEGILRVLSGAGVIKVEQHLITWTGGSN